MSKSAMYLIKVDDKSGKPLTRHNEILSIIKEALKGDLLFFAVIRNDSIDTALEITKTINDDNTKGI